MGELTVTDNASALHKIWGFLVTGHASEHIAQQVCLSHSDDNKCDKNVTLIASISLRQRDWRCDLAHVHSYELSFTSQLVGTSNPAKTVTVTQQQQRLGHDQFHLFQRRLFCGGQWSITLQQRARARRDACMRLFGDVKPSVNGTITGAVWIADTSSVSPQILNVSGQGAVAVSFSPGTLNFGAVTVGTVSGSKSVTLTNNNQKFCATLNSIDASGNYKVAVGTCGGSIAARSKSRFR